MFITITSQTDDRISITGSLRINDSHIFERADVAQFRSLRSLDCSPLMSPFSFLSPKTVYCTRWCKKIFVWSIEVDEKWKEKNGSNRQWARSGPKCLFISFFSLDSIVCIHTIRGTQYSHCGIAIVFLPTLRRILYSRAPTYLSRETRILAGVREREGAPIGESLITIFVPSV